MKITVGAGGYATTGKERLSLAGNPYYVKETKAPVGYNLNSSVFMVIATKDGG